MTKQNEASTDLRPPWEVRLMNTAHGQARYHIVTPGGLIVAICYREAEAQRLAAAPELLEALEDLVNEWRPLSITSSPTLITARAAIEKARGEPATHQGDPCIRCGVAHDDVALGPCIITKAVKR